jgi:hypothetical protein
MPANPTQPRDKLADANVPARGERGWKTYVTGRCREILNASPAGEPISGEWDVFLREMIGFHPEASFKVGCGVRHFDVHVNSWGGRTFWLVRLDGTETDFSFVSCVSPPAPRQDFVKACRTAVVPVVLAFKNKVFDNVDSVTCPVTGETVVRETAHIDHAPPWTFEAIVSAFIAELIAGRGPIDYSSFVEPTRDGETVTRFIHPETADRFIEFHNARAALRATSRRANLSVNRRQR